MDLHVHISEDLAAQLGGEAVHSELERRALEAFALEELRSHRITEVQLRRMLSLGRIELDGFLKAHGIYQDVTMDDINRDIAELRACLGR